MHDDLMQKAIELSLEGMLSGVGGPFGAIVVKDGTIIGVGNNQVTSSNDPTQHAEIVAIRDACKNLNTFQLTGCELYTSCEPCPMCLGAIYWARLDKVYYANTRHDAAAIGFDDSHIYEEISASFHERKIPFYQLKRDDAHKVFLQWKDKSDRIDY